MIEGKVTPLVI